MIEIDNPTTGELFLRLPPERKNFQSHNVFFKPSTATDWILDNGNVRFIVEQDQVGGAHLASIGRRNAEFGLTTTWTNLEFDLWRIILFDASSTNSKNTSILAPQAVSMEDPVQSGNTITLTWTNLSVGGLDLLNVTVTLTLPEGKDWLNASITATWVGTPTRYAIDSLCVLPIRLAPKQRGSDCAIMPSVFGILSKDPITNLRYDPADGKATTLFGLCVRNVWQYPSGRGWNMAVWGYYETVNSEGWMVWSEEWDLSILSVCFQSDGENILFECYKPVKDNVLVGNGTYTTHTLSDLCVRPLKTTSSNGWWDIGYHYKQRLETKKPSSFYMPVRTKRDDLSEFEQGPFVFMDFNHTGYTGTTTFMDGLITTIRSKLGITTDTPIFMVGETTYDNLITPYEAEVGDLRSTIPTLFSKNIFICKWDPGIFGPDPWSIYKWSGNQLRWWSNIGGLGSIRMSRQGYLAGGGDDRRNEDSSGTYYHERSYPVTGWDGGTKIVSITGNPSADSGFHGTLRAILIPVSGSARLAQATVTATGSGTVTVAANFVDGTGATATPVNGDSLEVYTFISGDVGSDTTAYYCPHALLNSASYKTQFFADAVTGMYDVAKLCGNYMDVFSAPLLPQPLDRRTTCYEDHSSWGKIDGGYVRHPKGGDSWYVRSMVDYIKALKAEAHTKTSNYMLSCEDMDEVMQQVFDFCWHTVSSGQLWRNLDGVDPTINKYKTVPFYAAVHAGRSFGRALLGEFSSALLKPAYRTITELHRTQAYTLASEWVYGLTFPTLDLWADATDGGNLDLWDDTNYVSGGGSASNEIKLIRDLWKQINVAETTWIHEYFRYGEALAPVVVDIAASATKTGYADSTYTNVYYSYDTIYDRSAYPRVVNSVWRSYATGAVLVLLVNWTEVDADWAGTLSMSAITANRRERSFTAKLVDYQGLPVNGTFSFNPATGEVSCEGVTAYSVFGILLTPFQIDASLRLIATQVKRGKRRHR